MGRGRRRLCPGRPQQHTPGRVHLRMRGMQRACTYARGGGGGRAAKQELSPGLACHRQRQACCRTTAGAPAPSPPLRPPSPSSRSMRRMRPMVESGRLISRTACATAVPPGIEPAILVNCGVQPYAQCSAVQCACTAASARPRARRKAQEEQGVCAHRIRMRQQVGWGVATIPGPGPSPSRSRCRCPSMAASTHVSKAHPQPRQSWQFLYILLSPIPAGPHLRLVLRLVRYVGVHRLHPLVAGERTRPRRGARGAGGGGDSTWAGGGGAYTVGRGGGRGGGGASQHQGQADALASRPLEAPACGSCSGRARGGLCGPM